MSILNEAKIEAVEAAAENIDPIIPEAAEASDYSAPVIDLSFLKAKPERAALKIISIVL